MRVLSGIQPTGNLHLGNFLGAIKPWTKLQDSGAECFFFLADLHAITVFVEPDELRRNVREMTAGLVACGLDPDKVVLFNHARVPAHPELTWILNCVARLGWLNRMTQFKEKSGKNREASSIGLYDYPVLQAADILLYQPTHIPVGDDQRQHIELCRDIAIKFNTDYKREVFRVPEPLIGATGARVMSLRDGTAKMSKSDPSDMSRVNLTDDSDLIAQKIRKAKTDPEPLPEAMDDLAERPEVKNLVTIYSALSGESADLVLARFAGRGFGAFKPALTDLVVETMRPIKSRFDELRADHERLDRILASGAEKAAAAAKPTLDAAYEAVGLRHGG
ncbi:MAG TPA: tryptophan--tRNA ligase [Allosphingosinicella sp.]|jgi:tryptophanyl-tRNA synthetase